MRSRYALTRRKLSSVAHRDELSPRDPYKEVHRPVATSQSQFRHGVSGSRVAMLSRLFGTQYHPQRTVTLTRVVLVHSTPSRKKEIPTQLCWTRSSRLITVSVTAYTRELTNLRIVVPRTHRHGT